MWIGLCLLLLVAFDASAFVCYITRFTEENFATLIAFIFIKKAFEKVIHIADKFPVHEDECYCKPKNATQLEMYGTSNVFEGLSEVKEHVYACEVTKFDHSGPPQGLFKSMLYLQFTDGYEVIQGIQSASCHYVPNAFLMSVLLFIGTFLISYHLKNFKSASFFPAKVIKGDFKGRKKSSKSGLSGSQHHLRLRGDHRHLQYDCYGLFSRRGHP